MAVVTRLKQSTAATLLIGPFLDETDGKTAETALTISQADVLLWKQGGTTLAQKNETTSATHRSNGLYTVPIDTTDTNTLGILSVSVHEAGALPIRQDYEVVPAVVYDEMFDSDYSVALRGLIAYGTAQSATATTVVLAAATSLADDVVLGSVLGVRGSTQGYWQYRVITDYVNSTDTATVDTWTVTPSGTITYVVFAAPPADATNLPAVNATKIGGQTASAAGTITFPGTIASTTNITAASGVTLAAATHTGAVIPTVTTVNGLGAGVITATSIAADAITAAKIADGAIDAATFAAGAINAAAIAADAITAAKIADGAIDAATFAAGAITASAIAADAIGASELAADAVTEIANATVEAELVALQTYNRSANTTASISGPTSGSIVLGVTVDGTYQPIKTL